MSARQLEEELAVWLSRLLAGQPPSSAIVAFNVGLFETESGYCAYLSGATKFDPDSDDWAVEEAYSPSRREFPLPRDVFPFSKWQDALAHISSALKAALVRPELEHSPLARAQAVTIGFDDGDLERVA